jgi:Mg2+ and Co2+ transporter CorA
VTPPGRYSRSNTDRSSPASSCGTAAATSRSRRQAKAVRIDRRRYLALYFAPHPLAIEDAIHAHQRPKLDIYDECLFVVLKTLHFDGLQQPMRVLANARLNGIHPDMAPYFRDVADDLARTAQRVEGFDGLLTDILAANLAQISIQQNEDSRQQNELDRRISAWGALIAVPTVITGIYGMNFTNMPELHLRYGYFVALAVILILDATLYRRFRRIGWL